MPQKQKLKGEILYGKNPIEEALKAGKRRIFEVMVAGDLESFFETELGAELQRQGVKVISTHPRELDFHSQGGVHQNVVAQVSSFPTVFLDDVLEKLPQKSLFLILDSLQDPQNFGTLCRSALAFGVQNIIVPKDRSVSITAAVCKASAGAIEHLNVIVVTNLARAMETLKKNNFWLYGAVLDDQAVSLSAVDPAARSAIVLGSEGKGLRRLVTETCDVKVMIPMATDFDSLNVAQAGTIMLYDFFEKMCIVDCGS